MKELTIPLKTQDKIPLYEQIYEYIRQDIADGKISPGEKLPSTRFLARHLQISRSTVDLAYDQLLSEGYIRAVAGSGYFVCNIETGFLDVNPPKQKVWQEAVIQEKYQYDFSPNAIEWSEFSMNAWRKAMKGMMQESMEDLFLPGSPTGEENLRQTICDYLHQARGVNCSVGQIIIGAGNEYLLMLLYQMLGGDGTIAMESPTYRQAYQIFCNLGWQVKTVPMDQEGMVLDKLRESQAQLAYIMPSHQFPLGNVMPLKRRMELLQWAGEKKGRYIIEDDYDSEFRYRGKPIPCLQGRDPYDSVIYLGTFSKSITPAIRVSYMVLPPELMKLYWQRCGGYSSTVSRFQQQMLYYFMKEGYFERHLNKMRRIYHGRHDTLLNELKGKAWVKRIFGENAGLHILVEVYTQKSEADLIQEAKEMGLGIYGLREYAIEEEPKWQENLPVLLLGYAGLTEEEIHLGIEKMEVLFR